MPSPPPPEPPTAKLTRPCLSHTDLLTIAALSSRHAASGPSSNKPSGARGGFSRRRRRLAAAVQRQAVEELGITVVVVVVVVGFVGFVIERRFTTTVPMNERGTRNKNFDGVLSRPVRQTVDGRNSPGNLPRVLLCRRIAPSVLLVFVFSEKLLRSST